MFSRVLIANRGEIACRIIRGCQELGCETVAVYSEPDARALHVKLADMARPIGAAAPGESYLNQDKLLNVARETGCDALHPGYGFLAENAGFAQAVLDAGLAWIGPPPAAIRDMGLKIAARETARAAGAPCIPGFEDPGADDAAYLSAAERIGYPVMVKASAGGGGKGMRTVGGPDGLLSALAAARREAAGAFGDATVYLERADRAPAPHRDPGAGRQPWPLCAPRRARVQHPAPAPEGGRGDAQHGGQPGAARGDGRGGGGHRSARGLCQRRARWSSSSTRRGLTTSSK